jgi:hypothetical protein
MTLSCLTLWAPWADAIIRGGKRIENRGYPPPASLVGEWLALHTGKTYEDLSGSDWPFPGSWTPPADSDCSRGVVAVARVAGVITPLGFIDASTGVVLDCRTTLDMAWWARGSYGWILYEVRAITPVPCNGHQRLWTLPDDVERAVRVQTDLALGRNGD